VANYLTNDYLAAHDISEPVKIASSRLAALANLVDAGKINSKQAKEVLVAMLETGEDPEAIVKARGMSQVTDVSTLEALCVEAIAANPRSVADYKAGKQAAINAFKGFIMKATKGQANPQLVDEVLRRKLAE
jgi:aspartyl-tRNA(Asn)/glutamyl-tRNA(Gln) amidotransferase subunit B